MKIDFIFDTLCPWCFVGRRRFRRALSLRPHAHVEVRWRAFLLNPDLPPEGIERGLYLDRKFGGPARVQRIHAAVQAAGAQEGIVFDFERITRTPNSLHSHRLIRFAARFGHEDEAVEAVFQAYFCHGQDIGRMDVLLGLGRQLGLPMDALESFMASDQEVAAVIAENTRAHRLGVNGVPSVIIDGTYALAGAQEPDILLRLIDIAREAEAEAIVS